MGGRKRVLNITSVKKRDTMLSGAHATDGTWSPANIIIEGGTGDVRTTFWAASARVNPFSQYASKVNRGRQTVFMRGLREDTQIEVSTAEPWEWRRIVFSLKGLGHHTATADFIAFNTDQGYMRGNRRLTGYQAGDDYYTEVKTILFRGRQGYDWISEMNAPINTLKATVHSDTTKIVKSGNESGHLHKYKSWIPFNKNFVYDDGEEGMDMSSSPWAADGKAGMGDIFVIDFYKTLGTTTEDDVLKIQQVATLYWGER